MDPFEQFLGRSTEDDDEPCCTADEPCRHCLAAAALLQRLSSLEDDERRAAVSNALAGEASRSHVQGLGRGLCAVMEFAGQGLEIVDRLLKDLDAKEGA